MSSEKKTHFDEKKTLFQEKNTFYEDCHWGESKLSISDVFNNGNRFMVVPIPSVEFMDDFRKATVQFWKSKTSKVSYDKIILSFERGGLKLVDLPSKNLSQKMNWIGRAHSTASPQ